jgi:hypothetical protein
MLGWRRKPNLRAICDRTAGGIIRELLDENDELTVYHSSQIEFHNNRLKQLSKRRARLEHLYAELQAKTGGNLDDEDEVDDEEDEVSDSEVLLRSADRIDDASDEEE